MEGQIRTQKAIRGRDRAFQSLSLRGLVAKDPGLVGWIGTEKSACVRTLGSSRSAAIQGVYRQFENTLHRGPDRFLPATLQRHNR